MARRKNDDALWRCLYACAKPFGASKVDGLGSFLDFRLRDLQLCNMPRLRRKLTPTLLSLPLEIRIKIYKFLLVSKEVINVDYCISPPASGSTRNVHDLCSTVLRLNRQIFHEAIDMLYSKNSFSFSASYTFPPRCPASLLIFFERIGENNASRVQSISICDLSGLCQSIPGDLLEREDYPRLSKTIRSHFPNLSRLGVHHHDFHYLLNPGSKESDQEIGCACCTRDTWKNGSSLRPYFRTIVC